VTTVERAAIPARSDSTFFSSMAVALALIVFAGFSRTFFLKSVFQPPMELSGLMIVHGLAFTAWIAVLIMQTSFIAAGRRAAHITLGTFGTGLAGAMVVLGLSLAIDGLQRGHAPHGAPSAEAFFAIPVATIALFLVLVSLGIANRSKPDWHKRFMILATAAISTAAVARIPLGFIEQGGPPVFYGVVDLFIVAIAIYDWRTKGRIHPATLWSAAIMVSGQLASLIVGSTHAWQAFAASLVK
jgi:hypothetical protein